MSNTPPSAAFHSRTFAARSPGARWSEFVAAMPIVIFFRGLRQALSR
jgi:hypothetical protein